MSTPLHAATVRFSYTLLETLLRLPDGSKIVKVADDPYHFRTALVMVEHDSLPEVPEASRPEEAMLFEEADGTTRYVKVRYG